MKKIDLIFSAITGEAVAILFLWLLKNSTFNFPILYSILPIFFPILAILGIFFAEIVGRKFLFVYQFAKFLLVGSFFAVFDLTVLNFLMVWFSISKEQILKYTLFVVISFVLATLFKYFANKYWAFEKTEKEKMEKEFSIFFLVTAISGLIQTGVASFSFKFLVSFFKISSLLAGNLGKIFGILVASIWNFLGYKFFVFKK